MAPTTYGDLGKSATDVFGIGYNFGLMKVELKTKKASGLDVVSKISQNTESGKIDGNLETKYKFKEYGTTFTEKWNTNNQLSTTVDVQDKILKGLKLTFDCTVSPQTGAKSGKVKAEYKNDLVTVNTDGDINLSGARVIGSAVLGHKGWLAGYQLAFDTRKSELMKYNFCLGYSAEDFVLHTNVDDGRIFGSSVYHKVNPNLETAINLGWTAESNDTSFGIGCKFTLDKNASFSAKVNNSSQLGLGYQQKWRSGVTLTLSTLIDGTNVQQGGHQIGLALGLEA